MYIFFVYICIDCRVICAYIFLERFFGLVFMHVRFSKLFLHKVHAYTMLLQWGFMLSICLSICHVWNPKKIPCTAVTSVWFYILSACARVCVCERDSVCHKSCFYKVPSIATLIKNFMIWCFCKFCDHLQFKWTVLYGILCSQVTYGTEA